MITLQYGTAKLFIEEGDILLFKGQSCVSWIIGRAGESTYSHIAMASWHNGDQKHQGLLECVEFREGYGGRVVSLEQYVKDNDGVIDVYRPISPNKNCWFDSEMMRVVGNSTIYKGKAITNEMRKLTGLPYGWRRILWIAQRKLPFLRGLYNITSLMNDSDENETYPVCSSIVAHCCRKHGFDFTKNRSDQWTEPSDFARSSSLCYLFTLTV